VTKVPSAANSRPERYPIRPGRLASLWPNTLIRIYHGFALPIPERALIASLRQRAQPGRTPPLLVGIGDDSAVLRIPPGHEMLVTTDFSLEGVHFRREWHPPESIGYRCLARGLSDIAAMGGDPVAAFLSLALPPKLPQRWVDRFFDGLLKLAGGFKIPLAGGDTSQSPTGILADIVVVGSVPRGKAILRSGARPGDLIYVTGELGGSAGTLSRLESKPKKHLKPELFPGHFFPRPRIAVGRILRDQAIPSSMIDTSDGLSTDLFHLCQESGFGAEIRQEAVPRATVGKPAREVDLQFALHGGEDYELLFTAPRGTRVPSRIAGVAITEIGYVRRDKRRILSAGNSSSEFKPRGWEHFRG